MERTAGNRIAELETHMISLNNERLYLLGLEPLVSRGQIANPMALEWNPSCLFSYSFDLNDIRPCVQPAKNWMPLLRQAAFRREWDYAGQSTGFSGSSRCFDSRTMGRAGPLDSPYPYRIRMGV